MPTPRRPKTVESPIVATSFIYTPPALAASTTSDVSITYNFVTGVITVSSGSISAAPGFIAEQAFSRIRQDYNVNLWTISTGTCVGLSFSNTCAPAAGQVNFRISNSSTVAIVPAALTMMMTQL